MAKPSLNPPVEPEDEALLYILSYVQEGMSDRDLAIELLHFTCLRGASEPLFYPRVRLPPAAAAWPDSGEETVITRGAAVEIAFGPAEAPDYIRTFVFGPAPDSERLAAWTALAARHDAAVAVAPDGVVRTVEGVWRLADRVRRGRRVHRFDTRLLAIG